MPKGTGRIECAEHGTTSYCIICVHLRDESGLEYVASPACQHGPAQAWCKRCDERVARDGGWNEASEAFADLKLFCGECYRKTLRRHRFVTYVRDPEETCDWSGIGPPDRDTPRPS